MARNKSALIWQIRAQQDLLRKDLAGVKATMRKSQSSMNRISKQINSTLRGAFGVFLVGSVFRNIGRTIAGFEKQIDKVAAVSGATEKEIKALREEAVELGRVSKFTAVEIGKLQEELARKGFNAKQISESSDAIRKLATVADSELGPAASSLAGTLKGFNLEAEESERIANIMAESFSKSSLDLEKFTVATANSGAIANALGVTLETNTARLGTLVDANIDASKAGTDLRKIYIELNKAGIDYDDALEMVSQSSDKVALATKLVGIRAAAALVILSEQRTKVDQLTESLGDQNQELNKMVNIMEDNLLTDLDKLRSAWDGLVLTIENGEGSISKALRSLTQLSTEYLGNLSRIADGTADVITIMSVLNPVLLEQAKAYRELKESLIDKKDAQALVTFEQAQKNGIKTSAEFLKEHRRISKQLGIEFEITDKVRAVMAMFDEQTAKNKKSSEEYAKSIVKLKDAFSSLQRPLGSLSGIGASVDQADVGTDFRGFGLPIDAIDNTEFLEKLRAEYAEINQFIMDQALMMKQVMISSTADAISGFTSGLVTGGLEKAFLNIAVVFADGIAKIGKQLILYGTTMLIAKKALKNPFANPVVAIAAGIAAVAASAALKSTISNASGGISSGLGGGGGGGFQNNINQQSINVEVAGRISGNDIVYVVNKTNNLNQRFKDG